MDTHKARKARKKNFTKHQMELIFGSLLGDGCLVKTTRGYAFRVNHGLQQKVYVDWKYQQLKDFVNSAPCRSGNCYYFRTVSHPFFTKLHRYFYGSGVKQVPEKLLQEFLSPFSLSVWVMDDGAKDGRQLRINTQGFSKQCQLILQDGLRANLGIETTLNRDKDRYRLRIMEKSMEVTRSYLQTHFIPSMLYKFSP